MKKITVIFGGTFNPFHIGHYEMLCALNEMPQVEKILIIPDNVPPHKEYVNAVSDEDRIEMCRIAAADFEKAEVSLIEFERQGKSFTFDTVTLLKKMNPETEFAIVCGGDMISSFDTWHRWRELIELVDIYAFKRVDEDGFEDGVRKLTDCGANIKVVNRGITAVSSTQLRDALATSQQTDLLPLKIGEYIRERNLYNES